MNIVEATSQCLVSWILRIPVFMRPALGQSELNGVTGEFRGVLKGNSCKKHLTNSLLTHEYKPRVCFLISIALFLNYRYLNYPN